MRPSFILKSQRRNLPVFEEKIMKKSIALTLALCAVSFGFVACSDDGDDDVSCSYTVPKCNADGTALLTCENGKETVKACTCSNNACQITPAPDTPECDYTGSKCSDDGTALLTCENGKETVKACTCSNNACESSQNPSLECHYSGSRCNADGTALLTCNDGKETAESCLCIENACLDESEFCLYEGTRCDSDNKNVVYCDEDGVQRHKETCYESCENGRCKDVACPTPDTKTCLDPKTTFVCENDIMVAKTCPEGLGCADGECLDQNADLSCTFDSHCSDDLSTALRCVDGKLDSIVCKNGESCVMNGKTPECQKTETCENFRNYCVEENGAQYAMRCDDNAAKDSKPYKKTCNAVCRNGVCTSNLTIGADCNPDGQWPGDTCIDNVIAQCNKKTKKVEVQKACGDDEICGQVADGDLNTPSCYEPCTKLGARVSRCISTSDNAYVAEYECIQVDAALGDGRLGWEMVQGTYNQCDMTCSEGKCTDYTDGIENVGKTCDKTEFKGYCHKSDIAVSCDFDPNTDEMIDLVTVEKCDIDEFCQVIDNDADCVKTCKLSDPPRYECGIMMQKKPISRKFTCQSVGDVNIYQQDEDEMDICEKGCNAATGQCN